MRRTHPKSLLRLRIRITLTLTLTLTLNLTLIQASNVTHVNLTRVTSVMNEIKMNCNELQTEVIQTVHDRMLQEFTDPGKVTKPTFMLVCGKPGVGKSYTVHSQLRLLFESAGYIDGVHFQYMATQAVVANQCGGTTIHHFAHVNPFQKQASKSAETSRIISRKLLPLRWIIIDEISQVEAALLYALHLFLEAHMHTADTYKRNTADNTLRVFAGVNIICAGDFLQLPPCKASGDLSMPPPYILGDDVSTVDNDDLGRDLFWRNVTHTVELTQQVRCKDLWYENVLDELREGRLSNDSYNFLHGDETSVCGTGGIGDEHCGNAACHDLTDQVQHTLTLSVLIDAKYLNYFLTSHFSFLTSHFSFLTSHVSFLISHFSSLISHFAFLTSHFCKISQLLCISL